MNVPNIGDTFLTSHKLDKPRRNVVSTIETSFDAGFVAHADISTLEPAQVVIFVGFVITAILIQVPQTDKKARRMKHAAIVLLLQSHHPVRLQTVAEVGSDGVCIPCREICPTVLH